jgi:alpha/beta superfamily hydrolase
VILGANHFFDSRVEPLMQSVSEYLDKRLNIERKVEAT